MIEEATRHNPYDRLTTPEDVAKCLVELARSGTAWMTGNTIRVDGGEDFVAARPIEEGDASR
jgi:NAD(P)-dependent dehydrogenase (short-subunit alcohol dehydrogenase family)